MVSKHALLFPLVFCLLISSPLFAITRTWSGAVSANWSDPANWSPSGTPGAGDSLVFPVGAPLTTTNDLTGLSVGPLRFDDEYTINGNELTLTGNVNLSPDPPPAPFPIPTFHCNAPLKLGASIRIGGSPYDFYNAIDVNGQTLTLDTTNMTLTSLNGSGTVIVAGAPITITGNGSFSGTINTPIEVTGSIPNANVTTLPNAPDAILSGTGTVGTVTMTGSMLSPGDQPPCCLVPAAGVLHTKSLSLGGSSSYEAELAPGSVSDAIQVTGTVTLNAALHLTLIGGTLSPGQSFTIIDNDGTDPVSGTVTGLPERATINLGGQVLRISYQGGDGNDVVLTVLADTSAVLTQNTNTTRVGEAWTLTDTVTSAFGTPAGSVSFSADGVALGAAPLVNGVASLTTSLANAGSHNIIAIFLGTGSFADNVSGSIGHTVTRGQTVVDARPRTPLFIGQSPLITVFVDATSGGSLAPTGAVSVSEGGAILGTQLLAGGAASFSLNPLAVGDHTLVVNYGGDSDFEASSETVIQSVILPAISIHGTRVLEGSGGVTTVTLVVSLSAPILEKVRVSFSTFAGSATEGEDYEKASGVIEFAPGELTQAIELHIFGDTFPESDETFSVLLSDPVNATIDTPSAVIVIANDDQIPQRRRASRH